MLNLKWILVAGMAAAIITACAPETRGPSHPNNKASPGGHTAADPAARGSPPTTVSRRGPNGDLDRDGIPNRVDGDVNGDGMPEKLTR